MSMIHKIGSAALAVALLAGISSSVEAAEWKGWNIHKPGYPNTVAMDKFAELLVQKTGGRHSLKMFHSGVLGSQPDAIEQLRIGGLAYWADRTGSECRLPALHLQGHGAHASGDGRRPG